ncbi:MAG: GHMP kinase [Firmicutes bacterium]|nr:GHMP kinase [Bacillota bacterium]
MDDVITGTASAPGSCGELVQGSIAGQPFLISCPINIHSQITVQLSADLPRSGQFKKIDQALQLFLKENFPEFGWLVSRKSMLPPGKGMASSTADIAASLAATAKALGVDITPEQIAQLALQVEPSDGVMFNELCYFDYLKGTTYRYLGDPPRAEVILLDPGGTVDTVAFNNNSSLKKLNIAKETQVKEALDLVKGGIEMQDIEMIGRGSTISALANQRILPKPELPEVIKWGQSFNAAGVVIAHSGTVMGLIIPTETGRTQDAIAFIQSKKPHWEITLTKLINGGVR